MSCQQSQQQCQPQPKCPTSPKCPPKSSAQCSPQAPAGCALGSGSGCGPSSGGSCCLSHHRHHGSHRCWLHSSDPCDSGSERQSGVSGCGHDSRNSC
uniref:Late cornified envelope protein 3D-like n=1 Tax=Neovison vison TaxID=452646 RepID=A0A8C7A977_NEOVI